MNVIRRKRRNSTFKSEILLYDSSINNKVLMLISVSFIFSNSLPFFYLIRIFIAFEIRYNFILLKCASKVTFLPLLRIINGKVNNTRVFSLSLFIYRTYICTHTIWQINRWFTIQRTLIQPMILSWKCSVFTFHFRFHLKGSLLGSSNFI